MLAVLEVSKMHNAGTWLELVAHTRQAADQVKEPLERQAMLDVAAEYERRCFDPDPCAMMARSFGFCASRIC
jgi:hypothetical protein